MNNNPQYNFNTSKTYHIYWPNVNDSFEINIIECGYEHCDPLHICGPIVKERPFDNRQYHLIKYITSGKGTVILDGKEVSLSRGDGFYVPLGKEVTYFSDTEDPWSYRWLGFIGIKVDSLLSETTLSASPYFHYDKDDLFDRLLSEIYEASQLDVSHKSKECLMLGCTYRFFGELLRCFPKVTSNEELTDREYVKKAVQLLQDNYLSQYNVADMAHDLGLSRSYLYKLFEKYMKVPPATYIRRYKISKACEMLKNSDMPISDVALASGFSDPFYFMKVFCEIIGVSPAEYRKNIRQGIDQSFSKVGPHW